MGSLGERASRRWQEFRSIQAVKEGRIHIIDADLVCNMGPRLAEGLEEVAKILHPEVFDREEDE